MEDINIDGAKTALLPGSNVYKMTKLECRMTKEQKWTLRVLGTNRLRACKSRQFVESGNSPEILAMAVQKNVLNRVIGNYRLPACAPQQRFTALWLAYQFPQRV
jgi:hypothetical protein